MSHVALTLGFFSNGKDQIAHRKPSLTEARAGPNIKQRRKARETTSLFLLSFSSPALIASQTAIKTTRPHPSIKSSKREVKHAYLLCAYNTCLIASRARALHQNQLQARAVELKRCWKNHPPPTAR